MDAVKDRRNRKIVLVVFALVLAVPLIALAQQTAFQEWAVTYDSSDPGPRADRDARRAFPTPALMNER